MIMNTNDRLRKREEEMEGEEEGMEESELPYLLE